MKRRIFATLAGSTLAASTRIAWGQGGADAGSSDMLRSGISGDLGAALRRYLALPGTKSYLVHAGPSGGLGRLSHQPSRFLFTASAYKTFVLGQYLRDVEAGLLSEDEQLAIDDGVRTLVAELGLSSIRIPDSTRRFFSYLLGAPAGVDLGWSGIVNILEGSKSPPGALRPPLNDVITLAGNARDFVSWYEQALLGAVFAKPATLREFKRIQAGSVQIPLAVPLDTPAYAKGGELPTTLGFPLNAKSFAGQMIVGQGEKQTPVTFCFVVNWDQSAGDFPVIEMEFFAAIQGILAAIKQALQ
jgi:beta-lactamase class A